MGTIKLSERHRKVFKAIVAEYVGTAEPVASRTIARNYSFSLSPATIRNVMADLEDLGLVVQPHTSAGRVPTNAGFRYFVNSLLKIKALSSGDQDEIRRQFQKVKNELEDLLRETPRILSRFSRYAGMVWSPRRKSAGVFRSIDFFQIDSQQILSLVVYPSGLIRTRVIPVEEEVNQMELARISSFINREFSGLPPEELKEKIFQEVEGEIWEFIIAEALGLSDSNPEEGEVYIEGQLNILDLPDFADRNRLRDVLRVLDEKRKIIRLLNRTLEQEGMQVFIGVEEIFQELKGVSLVSAVYGSPDVPLGSLGVLGPTRMDYSRIIPLVEYTSKLVSDLFISN